MRHRQQCERVLCVGVCNMAIASVLKNIIEEKRQEGEANRFKQNLKILLVWFSVSARISPQGEIGSVGGAMTHHD